MCGGAHSVCRRDALEERRCPFFDVDDFSGQSEKNILRSQKIFLIEIGKIMEVK